MNELKDELTASSNSSNVPTFIEPPKLSQMTDEQIALLLEDRRSRRLLAFVLYQETEELKEKVAQGKAYDKLTKKNEQLMKQIERIDAALEKAEHLITEVRALKMQAGLEV